MNESKIHHEHRHDSFRFFFLFFCILHQSSFYCRSNILPLNVYFTSKYCRYYDFKLQLILSKGHWHYLRFLISFFKDGVQTGKHFEADSNALQTKRKHIWNYSLFKSIFHFFFRMNTFYSFVVFTGILYYTLIQNSLQSLHRTPKQFRTKCMFLMQFKCFSFLLMFVTL